MIKFVLQNQLQVDAYKIMWIFLHNPEHFIYLIYLDMLLDGVTLQYVLHLQGTLK